MRAKAARGFCGLVLEAPDGGLAPGDAKPLAPASDIGRVSRAMGAPARRRMIVPGPARGHIDLETDFSAQALAGGDTPCCRCFCHLRFPSPPSLRGAKRRSNPFGRTRWIASRSLSSGTRPRDPLARNDGLGYRWVSIAVIPGFRFAASGLRFIDALPAMML